MKAVPRDSAFSRHYGAVIAANCRPGPGRGPAPAPGPDRWWWLRWRMFDGLMHDCLEELDEVTARRVASWWPAGWPSPESGLLSIRQMEWVRLVVIGGRSIDLKEAMFA